MTVVRMMMIDYVNKTLPLAALLTRNVDKKGAQSFKDCPVHRNF
jgi:hypothetical protein